MPKNNEKKINGYQPHPVLNVLPAYPNLNCQQLAPNFSIQNVPVTPTIMNYSWPAKSVAGNPMITHQYQQQLNLKICLLCKSEPKFNCARCDAYYCSTECQRSDWPIHRFTCFAMPPLLPIKSKNRTIPPISMLPKDKSNVKVTGFRRTNLCYVRSVEQSVNESFKKGCDDIMNFGKTAEPMVELPQPNTYALAYCNQFYYRVQILSNSNQDKIRVLFIDLGNVRTVCLEDLRIISSSIINILQHAVAIKLKGVQNYVMSEEEMEKFLKQFCDTEFKLIYNNDDDTDEKEFILRSLNSNSTLNEWISSLASSSQIKMNIYKDDKVVKVGEKPINQENARIKAAENIKHQSLRRYKFEISPFKIEGPQAGKSNFAVIILNNSDIQNGLFGCIERSHQIFLDQAKNFLKSYNDTREAHEPQVGEYCLANVESKWHRVKVVSIFEKIYTVVNIDTTMEYKVTCKQFRRYPKSFEIPCKTIKCKLDGLQTNTGNKYTVEFLQVNFNLNRVQRITKVTKIENNLTYVKMDELINQLKDKIRTLQSELSN